MRRSHGSPRHGGMVAMRESKGRAREREAARTPAAARECYFPGCTAKAVAFCPSTTHGMCAMHADHAFAELKARGRARWARGLGLAARRRWAVAMWFGMGAGKEQIRGNAIPTTTDGRP